MTDVAVSVVVPVYNGERFIDQAIQSVLAQTVRDLECIVVDDGSTDSTPLVVAAIDDPRVRYVRQDNRGVSAARNRGIEESRGEFVAFLDADDLWRPEKLERQLAVFRSRPSLGLVITGYDVVDEALNVRRTVVPDQRRLDLRRLLMLEASGIGLSFTGMVRRDVAEMGFDPSYSTSADLEFALRVRERHEVGAVPEPVALYRTHRDQMHLDLEAFENEVRRLVDAWMATGSALASQRRRALANLYTRLYFYEASRGNGRAALRALMLALRTGPDRLVMLPAWALATRGRHRAARRRLQRQPAATPRRSGP